MSLLGRLEDLPITDILQIVFLSRRTGILEIVRGDAKSQVLFQRGLIVGARSTAVSDLGDEMVLTGTLTPDQAELARKASAKPPITPLGQSLTDLGLVSVEGLGDAVLSMLRRVVEPLIGCEDGEFNFVLREGLDAAEIGYEPELVFRDKGVSPQKLLAKDGEKIVPLKALQDQMRTGKLMMSQRGMSVDDGRRGRESQVIDVPEVPPPAAAETAPAPAETPAPAEAEAPPTRVDTGPLAIPRPTLDFVEISATEEDLASIGPLQLEEAPVETPVAPAVSVVVAGAEEERRRAFEDRTVVILEPDPLVRVAVKRVLGRKGVRTFHFNDPGEVLRTIRELYDDGKFFVTILGFDAGVTAETLKDLEASRLLEFVRKLGRGYPALVVIASDDHRLRREAFRLGADVVLSRPPSSGLSAAELEAALTGFGDELGILAERYHDAWEIAQSADTLPAKQAGGAISELGRRERGRRSLSALKHLIAELAGTTEVSEVAMMILRVAGEYLDRAVFFLVGQKDFVGLGGFGVTGDGVPMNLRVRRIRIPISEPSVFSEVRRGRSAHRGKLKKTDWNQKLITQLGTIYPTEIVAIPVVNRDRVLAVVYGDNARDKMPIGAIDGLEIFLAQAGYAFESALVAGRKRRTEGNPDGDEAGRPAEA